MIRGVDVSAIQGVVPWDKLAAQGIRFAMLRCSVGNDSGVDNKFAENVKAAQAAGIAAGPYHFAYPLPGNEPGHDPAEQAKIAFAKSGGLGANVGDMPPALDLEWPAPEQQAHWNVTPLEIAQWGLKYIETAVSLWGVHPLVYTYPWFWKSIAALGPEVIAGYAKCPLWVADYAHWPNVVPPEGMTPKVLDPWPDWTLWQHTGGGMRLPNGTPCDFNLFNGDEVEFQSLLGRPQETCKPDAIQAKQEMLAELLAG